MIEMLNYLPGGRKNVFYRHLAQLFNWNEVDKTTERKFAELALSGHGKRFKEMQLRIISIKDSYIVFEVEAKNVSFIKNESMDVSFNGNYDIKV